MRSWRNPPELSCSLCHQEIDSHEHLFFRCEFAQRIWRCIQVKGKFFPPPLCWPETILWCANKFRGKSIQAVISRLLLSATIYFIWQERNFRIFKNCVRSSDTIVFSIMNEVRLRLHSLKFKDRPQVRRVLQVGFFLPLVLNDDWFMVLVWRAAWFACVCSMGFGLGVRFME